MWFRSLFDSWKLRPARPMTRQARREAAHCRPKIARLGLETLDDRCMPSFFPAVNYPGAPPVLVADFNVDGILDQQAGMTYLGNGDGTFRSAPPSASGETVADFNLDGWPDVMNGQGSVLLGNGDGTFREGGLAGGPGLSIAVGDLNNDGKPDAVKACPGDSDRGDYSSLFISPGNGDGTFAPPQLVYLPGTWGEPWSVAVADLDSDGRLDVVVATETSGGNDYGVTVRRGDGSVANLPGYGSRFAGFTNTLAIADVNGDGHPDIVSTIWSTVEVLVNLGTGNGSFAGPVAYAAGTAPQSPAVADINGDGMLDLVIANEGRWDGADYVDKGVSVLLGHGNGSFAAPEHFTTGGVTQDVAAGDFNGDGYNDLTAAGAIWDGNAWVSSAAVLINDGIWTPPPPPPPSITIGDVGVMEGNAGTRAATFTVNLSAASALPVTVAYATANDSASAGSDYQTAAGTLTFGPGDTSKTVTVTVIGDRVAEPTETFVVNLSGPTNATIADGQGVGTILDNEPRVRVGDVTRKEGRKGQTTLFVFTVSLSAAYDQPVTVSFHTADGTARARDGDYVARAGTLTFAPGETAKMIAVEVRGDNKREADEAFTLELSAAGSNALLLDATGLGTIQNDD
jgi:hypothetical protein